MSLTAKAGAAMKAMRVARNLGSDEFGAMAGGPGKPDGYKRDVIHKRESGASGLSLTHIEDSAAALGRTPLGLLEDIVRAIREAS